MNTGFSVSTLSVVSGDAVSVSGAVVSTFGDVVSGITGDVVSTGEVVSVVLSGAVVSAGAKSVSLPPTSITPPSGSSFTQEQNSIAIDITRITKVILDLIFIFCILFLLRLSHIVYHIAGILSR